MADLRELIEKALGSITFEQGVREAKRKVPQSYAFHTVSVGTLAYEICNAIKSVSDIGRRQLDSLGQKYGLDPDALCFFGGFLHDWNKLGSEGEARELIGKLGLKDVEEFLFGIATTAEGRLPDNLHMPLWIAVKLADMMMVSDITSVKDVLALASSPAYRTAVKLLGDYGLSLGYISTSFRLFSLVSSRELVRGLGASGYFPLISYQDGLLFLRARGSKPILLSSVADLLNRMAFSSGHEDVESKVNEIAKCLGGKAELFQRMNVDVKSAIYREDGKLRQLNELLPSKVCKPFEDVVGNLDNASKLEVAKRVVERFRETIPYGVLVYFVHKFSKTDEGYMRKQLGIESKSLEYLLDIKPEDVQKKVDELLRVLEAKYSSSGGGIDKTVLYFVKTSFTGDVMDDIPPVTEMPQNYCVVCGMPVFSRDSVRFVQYAHELSGKAEIWIPRERGLEDIDRVRDNWRICPICLYEANLMKGEIKPPYFVVSFYPGVPVRLLDVLDFSFEGVRYKADRKKTYLEVFRDFGGVLSDAPKRTVSAYMGSKVIVPAVNVTDLNLRTRLDKEALNRLLPYAPMLSTVFLTSPVMIGSTIYEIPSVQSNIVAVSSPINYTFMRPVGDNMTTLEVLLAYSAKFNAMRKACGGRGELENCLAQMVAEMDLFSSVDPALGVLSLGVGIGTPLEEDSKFFSSFLPIAGFLLNVAREVSAVEGKKDISSSVFSLAYILREVARGPNVSKYEVTGFFRDGVEMFFKTSSALQSKDDRVNIAVNAALASLENRYSLNESQEKRAFSALQNIFERLYEIEQDADRSLAISIANTITNWIYIAYRYVSSSSQGEKE